MKRGLELIRKLVLAVEEYPSGTTPDDIHVEGFTPEQIGYHSYLLVDASLAKGVDVMTISDTLSNWHVLHLTSAGHDFADAARSESTWNKAKTIVKDKAGGKRHKHQLEFRFSNVAESIALTIGDQTAGRDGGPQQGLSKAQPNRRAAICFRAAA
nr:DUF2513 domain-containing protein [Gammaproteobacteria bacterium]